MPASGFHASSKRCPGAWLEISVTMRPMKIGELGVLLGDFLEARRVGDQLLRRELLGQLVVAGAKLVQFFRKCKNGHCNSS